jgi:hypothetical protein
MSTLTMFASFLRAAPPSILFQIAPFPLQSTTTLTYYLVLPCDLCCDLTRLSTAISRASLDNLSRQVTIGLYPFLSLYCDSWPKWSFPCSPTFPTPLGVPTGLTDMSSPSSRHVSHVNIHNRLVENRRRGK